MYDGHGGPAASAFVSEHMSDATTRKLLLRESQLHQAISKLDSEPEQSVRKINSCLKEVLLEAFDLIKAKIERHR